MIRTLNTSLSIIFMMCIFLLQSCENKVNILGQYSSPYHKSLRQHTRSKGSYALEKVRFETQAVYMSDELRRAYVEEFSKKYRLSAQEKQELLNTQLSENAINYTFLIFHFSNDYKSSQINKNAENWKVRMILPGNEHLQPSKIEDVKGDALMLSYFYPQITPWSRNYKVTFPKSEQALDTLKLNLDSVEANLSFEWKGP